jgi:hypothetical protein
METNISSRSEFDSQQVHGVFCPSLRQTQLWALHCYVFYRIFNSIPCAMHFGLLVDLHSMVTAVTGSRVGMTIHNTTQNYGSEIYVVRSLLLILKL